MFLHGPERIQFSMLQALAYEALALYEDTLPLEEFMNGWKNEKINVLKKKNVCQFMNVLSQYL